jgi:hypothetical protein
LQTTFAENGLGEDFNGVYWAQSIFRGTHDDYIFDISMK